MKNFTRLSVLLLASFVLVFVSSCKEDPVDKTEKILVSVAEGVSVEVKGADATCDITVTADAAPAGQGIVVKLETDAQNGEGVLQSETVTIGKGQTQAVGKITFPLEKFPQGTSEKAIKVTISTDSDQAAVAEGKESATFKVRGEEGKTMPTLSVSTNGTTFYTNGGEQLVEITFTLDRALDEDLTITRAYGEAFDLDEDHLWWEPLDLVVPAGTTSLKATVRVAQHEAGTMPVEFSVPNTVSLQNSSVTFEFIDEEKPSAALCPIETDGYYALTKSFSFSDYNSPEVLPNPDYYGGVKEPMVDLTGEAITVERGQLVPVVVVHYNNVTGTGDPYRAIAWVDWDKDGMLPAGERLFYWEFEAPEARSEKRVEGTITIPADAPLGEFYMRIGQHFNDTGHSAVPSGQDIDSGCSDFETSGFFDIKLRVVEAQAGGIKVSVAATDGTEVKVRREDVVKSLRISLNKAPQEGESVTVDVAAVSSTALNGTLSAASVTFAAGEQSKDLTITFAAADFNSPDKTAEVTVSITSSDAEISETSPSVVYAVAGTGDEPEALCQVTGDVYYAYLKTFTLGDYTLPAVDQANATEGYTDLIAQGVTANITKESPLMVKGGNKTSGTSDIYWGEIWIDWNRDGVLSDEESALVGSFLIGPQNSADNTPVTGTLAVPDGTAAGTYYARVATYFKDHGGEGGCGNFESGCFYDLIVQYE